MYQNGKADGLRIACEKMNLPTKKCVYIGDALSDLQAAKKVKCLFVGYRNLAIRRCGQAIMWHWELLSLLS